MRSGSAPLRQANVTRDYATRCATVSVAPDPPWNDPLFSAIDADDPSAATLTYDHLKKGGTRLAGNDRRWG